MNKLDKKIEFYQNVLQLKLRERYPDYVKKIEQTIRELNQKLQDCNTDQYQQQRNFKLTDYDTSFVLFFSCSIEKKELTTTNIIEKKVMNSLKKDIQRIKKDVENIEDIVNNKITEITKTAQKVIYENDSTADKAIKKMGEQFEEDGEQFYIHFYLDRTQKRLIFYNIHYLFEKKSLSSFLWLIIIYVYNLSPLFLLWNEASFNKLYYFLYFLSTTVLLIFENKWYKKKRNFSSKLTFWDRITKWWNNEQYFVNEQPHIFKEIMHTILYSIIFSVPISSVEDKKIGLTLFGLTLFGLIALIYACCMLLIPILRHSFAQFHFGKFKILPSTLILTIIGILDTKEWEPLAITFTLLASIFSKNILALTSVNIKPIFSEDEIKKKEQHLNLLLTALPLIFYLFLVIVNDDSLLLKILLLPYLTIPIPASVFSDFNTTLSIFTRYFFQSLGIFLLFTILALIISIAFNSKTLIENNINKSKTLANMLSIPLFIMTLSFITNFLYAKPNVIFFKQMNLQIPQLIESISNSIQNDTIKDKFFKQIIQIIQIITQKPEQLKYILSLVRLGIVRTLIIYLVLSLLKSNKQIFKKLITWIEYQVQPISDWLYSPSDKNEK